jgi:hypothetical protein
MTVATARLAIRLVEQVGAAAAGTTVLVGVDGPDDVAVVDRWCRQSGNSVLTVHDDAVEVYRGRLSDPSSTIPADRMPGRRLWLYSNFHCNLACDYCCVSSSPRADPRVLPVDATVVSMCAAAGPTVVLTNGMLFRGRGLRALDDLPRDDVTLQISVDSPTPELHDLHRGRGSWQRAIDGVATARSLGFHVRLAATLEATASRAERALAELCTRLGLSSSETVVRRIAHQGMATRGVVVSRATVVPEVCVTAEGVYWHPVAATDPQMLVTPDLSPLGKAIDSIREHPGPPWPRPDESCRSDPRPRASSPTRPPDLSRSGCASRTGCCSSMVPRGP